MKQFNLQTALRELAVIAITLSACTLDVVLAFRWHGKASLFFLAVAATVFVLGINYLADHLSYGSLRKFAVGLALNLMILVMLGLYMLLWGTTGTSYGFMNNIWVAIAAVCVLPLFVGVLVHEYTNRGQYGTRLFTEE